MQNPFILSAGLHLFILLFLFGNFSFTTEKRAIVKPVSIELIATKKPPHKNKRSNVVKTTFNNKIAINKTIIHKADITIPKKIKPTIKPKRKNIISKINVPIKPKVTKKLMNSKKLLKNLQKDTENKDKNLHKESLTGNEIDLVRKQIIDEWNIPLGIKDLHKYQVTIVITMNPDRTVRTVKLKHNRLIVTDEYNVFANSVLNTITKFKYKPLLFPITKYKQWKELELPFTPPLN